mgnify:CR=1 FL=1
MDNFPPFLSFPGFSIHTFSLLMGIGVLSAALIVWRSLGGSIPARHLAEIGLAALAGSLITARLVHVALQWAYFSSHPAEIAQISAGGLSWHGALIGGLAGAALAARWRRVSLPRLLDAYALALPLLGAFTWYACASVITAHCAYGAEIRTLADAPAWAASESRDVFGIIAPRWNTQHFGLIWSVIVMMLIGWLIFTSRMTGRRFWLALALFSAGMFIIGFWRGDSLPILYGLRLDQWLDGLLLSMALTGIIARRQRANNIAAIFAGFLLPH